MRKALCAALLVVSGSASGTTDDRVTVKGEVVDSACWIKSGARGESHRICAQKCADAGIPLAIVEDGTGRLVWVASVDDAQTPNATLRPFAGRRVEVTGAYAERGGAKILLVVKVAAAPKE